MHTPPNPDSPSRGPAPAIRGRLGSFHAVKGRPNSNNLSLDKLSLANATPVAGTIAPSACRGMALPEFLAAPTDLPGIAASLATRPPRAGRFRAAPGDPALAFSDSSIECVTGRRSPGQPAS
jgi:hypothetical protein